MVDGFGNEAEEDRNLKLDLVGIDAIENAVKFGVVKGKIEGVDIFGLCFEC